MMGARAPRTRERRTERGVLNAHRKGASVREQESTGVPMPERWWTAGERSVPYSMVTAVDVAEKKRDQAGRHGQRPRERGIA